MSQKTEQEGDVRLDTTDTELNKRAQHLVACNFVSRTTDGYLDEKTVVVRLKNIKSDHGLPSPRLSEWTYRDLSACKAR